MGSFSILKGVFSIFVVFNLPRPMSCRRTAVTSRKDFAQFDHNIAVKCHRKCLLLRLQHKYTVSYICKNVFKFFLGQLMSLCYSPNKKWSSDWGSGIVVFHSKGQSVHKSWFKFSKYVTKYIKLDIIHVFNYFHVRNMCQYLVSIEITINDRK